MATESPLLHDGSQFSLSTTNDARRSSISGSTLLGPNGSGQFLAVYMSTTNDRQLNLATSTMGASTSQIFYGLLQNTPGPGEACDVGIFGITKAVAGATVSRGMPLQTSSTANGVLVQFAAGNGAHVGYAIESAVVGQVFTIALGFGVGSFST